MNDAKIVELYWSRSEEAIKETQMKYGKYCQTISYNILGNTSDAEECVNDTYLSAWNSMPEERPDLLAPFLATMPGTGFFLAPAHKNIDHLPMWLLVDFFRPADSKLV